VEQRPGVWGGASSTLYRRNRRDAQPGTLAEHLLRQARREPTLSEQRAQSTRLTWGGARVRRHNLLVVTFSHQAAHHSTRNRFWEQSEAELRARGERAKLRSGPPSAVSCTPHCKMGRRRFRNMGR